MLGHPGLAPGSRFFLCGGLAGPRRKAGVTNEEGERAPKRKEPATPWAAGSFHSIDRADQSIVLASSRLNHKATSVPIAPESR